MANWLHCSHLACTTRSWLPVAVTCVGGIEWLRKIERLPAARRTAQPTCMFRCGSDSALHAHTVLSTHAPSTSPCSEDWPRFRRACAVACTMTAPKQYLLCRAYHRSPCLSPGHGGGVAGCHPSSTRGACTVAGRLRVAAAAAASSNGQQL